MSHQNTSIYPTIYSMAPPTNTCFASKTTSSGWDSFAADAGLQSEAPGFRHLTEITTRSISLAAFVRIHSGRMMRTTNMGEKYSASTITLKCLRRAAKVATCPYSPNLCMLIVTASRSLGTGNASRHLHTGTFDSKAVSRSRNLAVCGVIWTATSSMEMSSKRNTTPFSLRSQL